MNKVILMGRLVRDPEVRYSQGKDPMAIARFTLAVNKRFKRVGESDADFIECVAFGKNAEFIEKYFRKGQMVSVVGRIQVRTWTDTNGGTRWSTDVVVEEQYFAESKSSSEANKKYIPEPLTEAEADADFAPLDADIDDDLLPF